MTISASSSLDHQVPLPFRWGTIGRDMVALLHFPTTSSLGLFALRSAPQLPKFPLFHGISQVADPSEPPGRLLEGLGQGQRGCQSGTGEREGKAEAFLPSPCLRWHLQKELPLLGLRSLSVGF